MNIEDPDKKEDFPPLDGESKKKNKVDPELITNLIESLKIAMTSTDEDIDQETLVKAVQDSRAFLLQYALSAYLDSPKNPGLLEGVTQIMAQIEKTVRDDRKERMKKKEFDGNRVTFNQMLEALDAISKGTIRMPVFDFNQFALDLTTPLIADSDLSNPIKPDELTQGIALVTLEGAPVDLVPPDDLTEENK